MGRQQKLTPAQINKQARLDAVVVHADPAERLEQLRSDDRVLELAYEDILAWAEKNDHTLNRDLKALRRCGLYGPRIFKSHLTSNPQLQRLLRSKLKDFLADFVEKERGAELAAPSLSSGSSDDVLPHLEEDEASDPQSPAGDAAGEAAPKPEPLLPSEVPAGGVFIMRGKGPAQDVDERTPEKGRQRPQGRKARAVDATKELFSGAWSEAKSQRVEGHPPQQSPPPPPPPPPSAWSRPLPAAAPPAPPSPAAGFPALSAARVVAAAAADADDWELQAAIAESLRQAPPPPPSDPLLLAHWAPPASQPPIAARPQLAARSLPAPAAPAAAPPRPPPPAAPPKPISPPPASPAPAAPAPFSAFSPFNSGPSLFSTPPPWIPQTPSLVFPTAATFRPAAVGTPPPTAPAPLNPPPTQADLDLDALVALCLE